MLQLNNTLIEMINQNISTIQENLSKEQARLQNMIEAKNSINVPKIDTMLSKMGLQLTSENMTDNNSGNIYLQLRVKPINGSIKPITHRGYTSSGAGKNHEALVNKAKKLEEKIFSLCGYSCNINMYGLEVPKYGKDFTFSVSLTIK